MDLARGGAADQKRNRKVLPFHLTCDVNHLVERWRNQTAEPDHMYTALACGGEDFLRWHHHAEIDHFIVVATQNDRDDVLPDIVDIAFHRRQQDLALSLPAAG